MIKGIYTIVITGVTKGLGKALAEQYIQLGHMVIGCGRSANSIESMSNFYLKNADFQVVDISDHGQVRSWAKDTLNKYGSPEFLLNNAGIINKNATLWNVSEQEFSDVIDINIKGVHNTIKEFVPNMIKVGKGTVVNFSSGWGRSTSPEVAPYCSSKWAIEGLSKSLAQELPEGMVSVALNPGVIDTDMLRSCWSQNARVYEKPDSWAKRAAPFILNINPKDNGASLTAP
ncbi:MAG: oxidoreductase [Candidatus Marinimicrobia bacterium]|nr:oxidoreductase [Candidatus Neomarinimicrobiota bacterium]